MPASYPSLLEPLAAKYIWWKTPKEALETPQRVMAQVMDIGDWDDVQALADGVGDAALRDVVAGAQAGQFNPRSWTYWHYRLGMAEFDCVPPLPQRNFGGAASV